MGNQHTWKVWHPDEDKKLAKLFPRTDTKELVDVFGCSVKVVQTRAGKLGIGKDKEWLKKFKSDLSKAAYERGCNSGFKNGNKPVNYFQKGNKPWNFGKRTVDYSVPLNGVAAEIRKPGSELTWNGYQYVQTVPGGRVINHRISDVSRRVAV